MYLHRIGRTARAGNRGSSLALVSHGAEQDATLTQLCHELQGSSRPVPQPLPFAIDEVQVCDV